MQENKNQTSNPLCIMNNQSVMNKIFWLFLVLICCNRKQLIPDRGKQLKDYTKELTDQADSLKISGQYEKAIKKYMQVVIANQKVALYYDSLTNNPPH